MEQDGGREHFIIGLDTAQLDRDAQGARAAFENLGAAAENVGRQIDQSFGKTDASALRKEMAETEKAIKEVQACIAANSREVEDFKAKIQAAQTQLANGGDKDALTSQIQAYRDTIAAITANSQEFAAEQVQLKSSLSAMSEQWAQLTTDAQQAALAQQAATEAASASASVSAGAQASESVSTATNTEAIAAKTAAEGQAAEATARAAEAAHSAATGNNEEATSVRALKEELKTLSTGLGEINQGLAKFADNAAIEQQERRVAKLADSIAKYKEMLATGKADAGTLGAQKEMERLNAAYDKAVEKLNAMKMEQARLQSDQQQYAAAIESTKQKIDEAGNAHTRAAEKVKTYKQEAQKIPTIHNQIAETMKTIGTMTAGYFTVKGIEGFIQKCIEVRKNLELMETRFQGLMGDAGTELLGEIKQMAMDSGTYTTKALSEVAQTLNVYGIETEQIMPLLREFGDVAMGNEQKLSSLAMAFGRLETQGQLSSLTLRTFTRAGFNPLEEMARKTGKSMQQLRTEMSAGLITTQKVKDALKSATSQGGKFYQMTENLSDSIAAEQGRLQMMITKIYAEWGKNHEDMIKGGYQLAQSIVANYETIGKAIATLIAAYGSYRTVLVVNSVLESTRLAALARLIRMQGLATVAQHALNAACKANPYVLLATAVLSLVAAFAIWTKNTDATAEAQERAKQITDETKNATDKFNQAVDNLMGTLQNSTASTYEHANALKELKKKYPNILKDIHTYNDYLREQQRIEAQIAQSRAYDPVRNAKKNLDVAKQDLEAAKVEVANAKAAYDMTARMGGEGAEFAQMAAYNQLKFATEKQTAAQKEVNQFQTSYNKAQQEYKKLVAQAAKEETVHNKAYYEKRKQAAQATIDAMDVSKKGSKEWTKAQKDFIEADTQLQKYSLETTKQRDAKAKAEERRRAKEAKAEERIENQELDGKKKAAEALRKWNEKQAEVEANAEWNRRQAVIDAMEEGSQKQLEQLRLNHDKEMAEIDREAKELWKARVEYQKEVFESKPANKHKDFYKSDTYKALLPQDEKHPLTKEEEDKTGLTAKRESSDVKYIREQKGILESQQQALSDYLKTYGNFEEQRLGIAKEYAARIAKAEQEGNITEVMKLRAEQNRQLDQVDAKDLLDSANLATVFEDFGLILSEPLRQTVEQLEKYTKTEHFKSRSLDEQKTIYDAIDKARKQLNDTDGSASVRDVAYSVAEYNNALVKQAAAQREAALATMEYVEAEKKLNAALAAGEDATIIAAKSELNSAYTKMQTAKANENDATAKVAETQNKANKQLNVFNNTLTRIQSNISGLKSGSWGAIWNLFGSKTQKNLGAAMSSYREINKQIESMATLLSQKGLNLGDIDRKLEDAIKAVTINLSDDITSPELIEKLRGSVTDVFGQVFGDDAVNFSGVTKEISNLLTNIVSSSEKGGDSVQDTVDKITNVATDLITKIAETGSQAGGMIASIIGLVLNLLGEMESNGLSSFIYGLFDKIGHGIGGLLENLFQKLIPQIIHGVGSLIEGIVSGFANMISFGAAGSLGDALTEAFGSNAKRINEALEDLANRNELLTTAIDRLRDTIEEASSGVKAINATDDAIEYQKEKNNNLKRAVYLQSEYVGDHHSFNYYWSEKIDEDPTLQKRIKEFGKKIGREWSGAISELTFDELEALANDVDLMTAIQETGKGNYGVRVAEKIQAAAEEAGTIQELIDGLKEKLTQTTFDSLRDNFVSALMDMDATAEDFSDNFSEMLMQSVLNAKIADLMDDQLQTFYDKWAEYASGKKYNADGSYTETNAYGLSQGEVKELKNDWERIVNAGLELRDQASRITGYDGSDSDADSSTGAWTNLGEETGRALEGRFAALQIQTTKIADIVAAQYEANTQSNTQRITALGEMNNLVFTCSEHLERIAANTDALPRMEKKLESIKTNTDRL